MDNLRKGLALSALTAFAVILSGCSSSSRVTTAPAITVQPADQTVSEGRSAVFSVTATGSVPLSYQWQRNGSSVQGAISSSYSTPPTTPADNGASFRVLVSNAAGTSISNPALLTVLFPPSIQIQPADQSVTEGASATFSVVATGTQPLNYQWQKNGTDIGGATSQNFSTPATTLSDSGSVFRVVVQNALGSATSNPATLTVHPVPPTIIVQPSIQTVDPGQMAAFTVVATGVPPLSYQWQKNGTDIGGATSSIYITPPAVRSDNGAHFRVVVTNSGGSANSNAATLVVRAAATVLTYHNDNARTGHNLAETILTLSNVRSASFGKLGFFATDGLVDSQPLYLGGLMVSGSLHNVLYATTEHDTVYAFDADTGAVLWQVSALGPGETPSDIRNCGQVVPEIGITSTPVIDPEAGPNGVIFLVAMSRDAAGGYHQRLHALDLTNGAELPGSPKEIVASYPGTAAPNVNGRVTFDPAQYKERAALLLLNGVVYTSWASHCDIPPYTGWVIGYEESTLAQTSVLNLTPNGDDAAIWQAGGGLAADFEGNIYALAGNGTFDTTLDALGFPERGNFGNAFLKLSTTGGQLAVADYFTMFNTVDESAIDQDLGSGGPILLPDLTDQNGAKRKLAVGAGKDGNIYVVNRDSMGKFVQGNTANSNAYQVLDQAVPGGVFSVPGYFNGTVYFADVGGTLKAFPITNAKLSTVPGSESVHKFVYPGGFPSISADFDTNAIVWIVENSTPAILHAYDATNVANELYNSSQAPNGRDDFGAGNKFIAATVVNGKVYVGTPTGVAVFGLLGGSQPANPTPFFRVAPSAGSRTKGRQRPASQ